MKTLYIMRHSKAEDIASSDFDRKLVQNGIDTAHMMGLKLESLEIKPDLVLSSPAARTKQTAQIVVKSLNYDKEIAYNETIYNAHLNELIEVITYTYDNINELFLVGHNPSLGLLAYNFVNFKEGFKKSMVMKVEFDCDSWMEISKENAKLCWIEQV